MESLQWLSLPDYASWDWQDWALYAAAGAAGYFIRLSVTNKPLRLPRRGERGLFLNSLGELATSMAVATLADHNLLFATCAGAGAPDLARVVISWMQAALKRLLAGDDNLVSRFIDTKGRE